MIDCKEYSIVSEGSTTQEGWEIIRAAVKEGAGAHATCVFEFQMVQRQMGLRAGAWVTKKCFLVADV